MQISRSGFQNWRRVVAMPSKYILHRSDCGLNLRIPDCGCNRLALTAATMISSKELDARHLSIDGFFSDHRGPFAWVRMARGKPTRDLCNLSLPAWDDYLFFGPDRKWFESLGFVVERGGSRAAMCVGCSRYVDENATACHQCGPFDGESSWGMGYGCSRVVNTEDPCYSMFAEKS